MVTYGRKVISEDDFRDVLIKAIDTQCNYKILSLKLLGTEELYQLASSMVCNHRAIRPVVDKASLKLLYLIWKEFKGGADDS